jgi:serine/threonine-protein kinase
MKILVRAILCLVLASALWLVGSAVAGSDRYAAVAFSPSTGAYGYGNGYATKAEAIQRARRECGESDAVTKWARNAWLALAVSGDGGYGSGWGTTAGKAREMAVESCLQHNAEAKVVVCISAYR